MQRKAKKANLRLENLENRNLLAGDVTVQLIDGTLFVAGDQDANGVELTSTSIDGQVVVSGLDVGGAPTTINGESTPLVIEGVERSVRISLRDGDDVLRVPNLDIDGALLVRTGTGDDSVRIGDAEADAAVVDIARGAYVNLGPGDDRLGISHTHANWMRINAGAGNDTVVIHDSAATASDKHRGSIWRR